MHLKKGQVKVISQDTLQHMMYIRSLEHILDHTEKPNKVSILKGPILPKPTPYLPVILKHSPCKKDHICHYSFYRCRCPTCNSHIPKEANSFCWKEFKVLVPSVRNKYMCHYCLPKRVIVARVLNILSNKHGIPRELIAIALEFWDTRLEEEFFYDKVEWNVKNINTLCSMCNKIFDNSLNRKPIEIHCKYLSKNTHL